MSGAKRAFLAALLILGGLGPARATTPIEIVLAPLYGAVASIRDFAPLRAHLQKTLGRPVESVSARDHASQLDQLRRHRYDYAVVPPHLAQQLSAEGRYHPLMTITGPDPVVLIAHHDPVETPREHLAGMRLALPDDASLASWTAQRVMPERLADARRYPNNLAAATAVSRGLADAAIVQRSAARRVTASTAAPIAATLGSNAAGMVLIHRNAPINPPPETFAKALAGFRETPKGAHYLVTHGHGALRTIDVSGLFAASASDTARHP